MLFSLLCGAVEAIWQSAMASWPLVFFFAQNSEQLNNNTVKTHKKHQLSVPPIYTTGRLLASYQILYPLTYTREYYSLDLQYLVLYLVHRHPVSTRLW